MENKFLMFILMHREQEFALEAHYKAAHRLRICVYTRAHIQRENISTFREISLEFVYGLTLF